MKDRIMVDASMILHQDSLHYLMEVLRKYDNEKIVISNKLIEMLEKVFIGNDDNNLQILEQLAIKFEIQKEKINPELIGDFLFENDFSDNIVRYSSPEIANEDLYNNLLKLTDSEWFTQILYEEWEFLTTNSWLIAKIRTSFDKIVEAGATAIQMSQKAFEKVVRKTIKKPDGDISPNDKLLAGAKWIAVGGSAMVDFFNPVAGVILNAASGMFLLCDP